MILKALEKDAALRYQSAADLRGDLVRQERDASAASRGEATGTPVSGEKQTSSGTVPPASRRGASIGVAVVAVALLAGAGYFAWRGTTRDATPGETAPDSLKAIQPPAAVAATHDRPTAGPAFDIDPDGARGVELVGFRCAAVRSLRRREREVIAFVHAALKPTERDA